MNTTSTEQAAAAIYTYTFGMDTSDWELATSRFAEQIDVDYSAVGAPKSTMSRTQFREFLAGLLGKPDLRVHSAVAQVFGHPAAPGEFIAYYSVRHYRGPAESAAKFAVFGWYRFRLTEGRISTLKVEVSATEGSPAALA